MSYKRAPTKALPSADYLRACFDYNPSTGELVWKTRPHEHFATNATWLMWNSQNAGKPAGLIDAHGYCVIQISRRYRAHRVIWKLVTGDEPSETIDHCDGNRSNNAWCNLRKATMREQNWNARFPKGITGRRGVIKAENGRYGARIKIGNVRLRLGGFSTIEEASAAYEAVARKAFGGFYREQDR